MQPGEEGFNIWQGLNRNLGKILRANIRKATDLPFDMPCHFLNQFSLAETLQIDSRINKKMLVHLAVMFPCPESRQSAQLGSSVQKMFLLRAFPSSTGHAP